MKDRRISSTRDYWKALIREHGNSGLSAAEFCEAKQISKTNFYSWTSKLRRKPTGDLIRVEMAKETVPLKIVFQNGVALHFAKSPEPEFLRVLLELVS